MMEEKLMWPRRGSKRTHGHGEAMAMEHVLDEAGHACQGAIVVLEKACSQIKHSCDGFASSCETKCNSYEPALTVWPGWFHWATGLEPTW
jgi:hypothetical protein